MSKKKDNDKQTKNCDPITDLAIKFMNDWAKTSVKSAQDRGLVEKFILESTEREILIAYTHIRKFKSFPNERFFHLIGERISEEDLGYAKDFLKSKLRSKDSIKATVENTRKR